MICVLVVDDHRIVREGLRAYLSLMDDIEMVDEAADGRGALDALARAKAGSGLPDVVLMDLLMEPMDGIAATAAIKERYPEVEVVAVTSFVAEEKVVVPTAVALFPAETPANPPREWAERSYNIRRWREMHRGGHFPFAEEPELYAEDLRDFFRR